MASRELLLVALLFFFLSEVSSNTDMLQVVAQPPLSPKPSPGLLPPKPTPLTPKPSPLPPQTGPMPPKPTPLTPKPSPLPPQTGPLPPKATPLTPKPSPLPPQSGPLPPKTGPLPPKTGPLPPKTGPLPPKPAPGIDCDGLCKVRCSLHSRPNVCTRACGTCCLRCKCVPPGTSGNREACGTCYTSMKTHNGKPKCP